MQKKIFMIDKEILLIARNSDHSESHIEKNTLIIFKESYPSAGNPVNFDNISIKVRYSRKMHIFRQKVCEFYLKLSFNSKTFLELGSQDPPLFAGLMATHSPPGFNLSITS